MTAVDRAAAAFARLAEVDRPEVWITLRPVAAVLAEAAKVDAEPRRSLSGMMVAVKDNIDVAGLPTSAACPAFAYTPARDAPAVARLRAAGAIVIGKTNLDQFATGLVGTRSPYGAVRDVARPDRVSGGSSSGSAVAVAVGVADIALGTDTAGSGRVPAAFQGIIGVKPTRGLITNTGVVPACRTFDCVSVFARDLVTGETALWEMADPDPTAPAPGARVRPWPPTAPLSAPPRPRIAVPAPAEIAQLSPAARDAFSAAVARLVASGAEIREIDLAPFLAAGRLLYRGAFVAERYAAVGAFVDAHPQQVDPTVRQIIAAAGGIAATRLLDDGTELEALRLAAESELGDADALLLPTVPRQPTIAEVAADPLGVNDELGRFTSFANLLDLCAIAVPAGQADGGHFGVTLLGSAFSDRAIADLAARLLREARPEPRPGPGGIPVLMVGAHRSGHPLNHQLTSRGARLLGVVHTTPDYRMHALATEPPKPGLVRVAEGGVTIEGELWELPGAHLGSFLAAQPAPMTLGQVRLADGRSVVGFGCEAIAVRAAPDISAAGSWPAYLAAPGSPFV